jgi:hypothetical protein
MSELEKPDNKNNFMKQFESLRPDLFFPDHWTDDQKEKAVDWFSEINESFILNLFADNRETYIGLYNSHLELWIKTHEWVRNTANFKYARVSRDWFSKTYRPLEIPKWQD